MTLLLLCVTFLSLGLTRQFPAFAAHWGLLDEPNQRSAHQTIKPRGAGVVFISLWLVVCFVAVLAGRVSGPLLLPLLPGTLLIAGVSLLDDRYALRARTRIIIHSVAVLFLLFALGGSQDLNLGMIVLSSGILASLLIVGACLWSINLFNFMDGTDGLAGVEALFVFGGGAFFLFLAGAHDLAWLAVLLCGAVVGFLRWNWPESRLFMGDVGSASLGFLVVAFALVGQSYGIPLTLWLILYGVFVFDASVTLIRRLLAGERWYEAHKLHAYQRLCQLGWGHQKVLLGVVVLNTTLFVMATIAYFYPALLWLCALSTGVLLTTAYFLVEYRRPMFSKGH